MHIMEYDEPAISLFPSLANVSKSEILQFPRLSHSVPSRLLRVDGGGGAGRDVVF